MNEELNPMVDRWTFNWTNLLTGKKGQWDKKYDSKKEAEDNRHFVRDHVATFYNEENTFIHHIRTVIKKVVEPKFPKPTEHDVVLQDGRWT